MTITWQGGQNFTVKAKGMNITLGEKNKLGDLEITEPGEYEVGGTEFDWSDGIIQVCTESMTIGHIKKAKIMTDEEMEKLNGIDILLIGVGGGEFAETKTAIGCISQIDPAIVIPMYKDSLEDFAKEEGGATEPKDEFKATKGELPIDGRQVVVLNAGR